MNTKRTFLFLPLILLIVFIFFYHTLFFGVKLFDEIIPFKETYLPACFSLSEMFELISLLGLHQHFEATNTLYSNIVSLRCNPFGNFLQMFIQLLFKKNPVNYHAYSLCLHLINTAVVFLLINAVGARLIAPLLNDKFRLPIVSLLTLLWALHPVNIESVLLLTNANIVLSYTFSFLTTYLFLSPLLTTDTTPKFSLFRSLLLFLSYCGALFTAEFHFMLPFILISYLVAVNLYYNKSDSFFNSLRVSLKNSLQNSIPLLVTVILFILFFTLSNTGINIKVQSSLELVLERIFWLSPQILFHFVKLLFLPIKLSIDQSLFVIISKSLFAPYAIFCILFIFTILFFSIFSLLRATRRFPFFFITFSLLFLSLIPFSQIPAPVYNLASERYLYFPSFVFIFGSAHIMFYTLNKYIKQKNIIYPFVVLLVLITIIYSTRAFIRTLDWKDSSTLYYSAIKATDNPLNKAFRYKGLTPQNKIHLRFPEHEVNPEHLKLGIKNFKKAIADLKKEKIKYQPLIPATVRYYGLDPDSLIAKAGYLLAQTDFTINRDYKRALKIITPYTKDLSKLDSAALSFYASLLFYNELVDESEKVLRKALEIAPYSTRIIFPLCDLIFIKNGDFQEIEKLSLKAFKYFSYDTYTLFVMIKMYKLKEDFEKFANFSHIYGIRHHSIEDLKNAEKVYLFLNKKDKAEKARKRMEEIENYLSRKRK